jgi:prevent-host-death family protein
MPNIKPISDLRNYSEVLHDVAVGAPVFLTKNGRGKYAIVDMQDYEKMNAVVRLLNELSQERKAADGDVLLSEEEKAHFDSIMQRGLEEAKSDTSRPLADVFADLRANI